MEKLNRKHRLNREVHEDSNECLYWAFARNFNGETTVVCVNTDDNPHHFSFNYNGRQYDIDVNGRDTEIV